MGGGCILCNRGVLEVNDKEAVTPEIDISGARSTNRDREIRDESGGLGYFGFLTSIEEH
jgi:hypothetical protein